MYKLQHEEIVAIVNLLEAQIELNEFEKNLLERLKHFICSTKITKDSQNG